MMTKIVDFLEQQVQWVAIGVGALFLAFTIWTYVVNNPITTSVRSTPVDLGTVDQTILDTAGTPLKAAMDSPQQVPDLENRPASVGDLAQMVRIDRSQYQATTLKGLWLDAPTQSQTYQTYQEQDNSHGPVVTLVVPPAPELVGVLPARAQVAMPDPAAANSTQPAVEDKNWVTIEGKISIAPLSAMLTEAHYPAASQLTEFLRVEVQREEQLPDGSWGNPTTVQPPVYLGIPPWPSPENAGAKFQYATWAKGNAMLILQPPFYNVVKGQPWYLPSDTATAQALATPNGPAFDPTDLKMAPQTPDQKKARLDYLNSQQYKDFLRQRNTPKGSPAGGPQGAPPPPGGGGFGPQGMAPAQDDPGNNIVLAQFNPGRPMGPGGGAAGGPPGGPPGFEGGPPGMDQQNPNPAPNLQPNAAAAVQKAAAALPQGGQFDPAKQQDVSCWAFDDSAQPGKTYRYRFRYMVLNPVQTNPSLAGNNQVRTLALTSDYSDWSSVAKVQPDINFFVATGISSGSRVNFKIYKWQNGETSVISEQDAPGDIIGAEHSNANGVDYTTQWTMVAIRRDYDGENYVLLIGPDGQIVRHDYHGDELDPINRDLQRQLAPPPSPVNNNPNPPQRPAFQPRQDMGRGR
jgi:hypothetical protein